VEHLRQIREHARGISVHARSIGAFDLEAEAFIIERKAMATLEEGDADGHSVAGPPHDLSGREIEVLRLVTDGLPDKQIAQVLGISTFTVNKHVGAILAKMHASSRTEASVRAILQGFVQPRSA